MSIFKPDQYTPRLRDIDFAALWDRGIRGLILDLDNTLQGYGHAEPSHEDVEKIKDAKGMGFEVCVISNNFKGRVAPVAELLGVEYVASAKKPFRGGFRRALKLFGLGPERVAIIGDQVLTDILGGNRVGIYTILINPLHTKDFPFTRLSRMVERCILARLGIERRQPELE